VTSAARVGCLGDLAPGVAQEFLAKQGLALTLLADNEDIPASYWGAPEAGIIGNTIYARPDTPIHSILHTACHWLCMDEARRASLHTSAGGDDAEEVAVCYLQCLLAEDVPGYSRERMFCDMDLWEYQFRFGYARRWFEEDAEDAREWLLNRHLIVAFDNGCKLSPIDERGRVTGALRC
jgi:hypothetical protein